MAMTKKYLQRYNEAYKDLRTIQPAITFTKDSPYYHMEEWRFVRSFLVLDVPDMRYKVSNYGRVYDTYPRAGYPEGKMMNILHNSKGYPIVCLKSISKDSTRSIAVSRLIMLHFRFVEGCQFLEVDHVDGNKENNMIWNLQWVSPQENTHRAITNNLRPINVKADTGIILTDEQARELFKEASKLKNQYRDLANKYQVTIPYMDGLVEGSIRPYIANRFYNGNHSEIQSIEQQ